MMRLFASLFISVLPFNRLRIALYRILCGYDIDFKSYIGPATWLYARSVRISSARIGPFNRLWLDTLQMAPGAVFGKYNTISHVRKVILAPGAHILHRNFIGGTHRTDVASDREDLTLGENSQISIGCFFDLSDSVTMGRDVVVAGARTQFWTHGFDHRRRRRCGPITIANNVFLGSASVVVHDVNICDDVVVGAGSVVHRSITEPGLYASNQLRRIH